ncbi:MAG: hypothetical protein IPP74_07290 [Alphaproteobacteria bacterium]|nr:hypothetical protein [Alphaproteobacteria bacterium]
MRNPNTTWADTDIKSLAEFKTFFLRLKEAVISGELSHYCPKEAEFATNTKILDISNEGPWPDYIEWYFTDLSEDRHYMLSVEMYHGTGGIWKAIDLC